MKVLVIGRGGREHALVWKLAQSKNVEKIYCAPGNAGIAELAECIPIEENELTRLADFAELNKIGLTVVGPEEPLAKGIVDIFRGRKLKIFGPTKAAAQLESSKVFSKEIMVKAKVKTAPYEVFSDPIKAMVYAKKKGRCVVKADGLAAGKGVFVCRDSKEAMSAVNMIMNDRVFGDSGRRIIIEDLLEGEEASILAFCDGKHASLMVPSQDHKRVFDNDEGPNTGGMGAYSPAPLVNKKIEKRVLEEVIMPVLREMSARGTPYSGVLYAGLMINKKEINVLEFNVRFGDPETQVVLPRLKSDLADIMLACASGTLEGLPIKWDRKAATCVVMASKGYPGRYEKGKEIKGLEEARKIKDVVIFHAGTKLLDGKIVTNGGRVLGVTALADSIRGSIRKAYKAVSLINFEGVHYRHDIGKKALKRKA